MRLSTQFPPPFGTVYRDRHGAWWLVTGSGHDWITVRPVGWLARTGLALRRWWRG